MMASQVLYFYLGVYYLLPILLVALMGWHRNFAFVPTGLLLLSTLVLFALSMCVIGFSRTEKRLYIRGFVINVKFLDYAFLVFIASFFILSLYMAASFGSNFRHAGPALSDAGSVAILFTTLKVVVPCFLLYRLRKIGQNININYLDRITGLTLVVSLIIFPIAAFDAVYILILSMLSSRILSRKIYFLGIWKTIILGVFVLSGLVYFGLSSKIGFEESLRYLSEYGDRFLVYLQYRVSVFYASFIVFFVDLNSLLYGWLEGVSVVFDSIVYRLGFVLGLDIERPYVTNINVLNFRKIYPEYNDLYEIGASPGLLLSFFYYFPAPLAFLVLLSFIHIFSRILNNIANGQRPGYLVVAVTVVAFYGVISNPLHMFLNIGPELVKGVALLMTSVVGLGDVRASNLVQT